jgi:translation initiation factor IF-3
MAHTQIGKQIVQELCEEMEDVATPESDPKLMGKTLSVILAPGAKKKKETPPKAQAKPDENEKE